jgi:hypothetical protein
VYAVPGSLAFTQPENGSDPDTLTGPDAAQAGDEATANATTAGRTKLALRITTPNW